MSSDALIDKPGVIGVLAQETARFSMFAASMTGLAAPEGSSVKWIFGHDIAENANKLVEEMYDRDVDWLWIMGDDHAFSGQILLRLLAHDKDVCVPLCLMRNAPYRPVIFSELHEGTGVRVRVNLDDHPAGGLIPVHSAGSAGMLIKRAVFDFVGKPWFESGVDSSVQLGEDVYFCDKARDAGFEIFADLDTVLGHCATHVVWPVREEDGWTFGFSMMGGFQVTMPPGMSVYADEIGAA